MNTVLLEVVFKGAPPAPESVPAVTPTLEDALGESGQPLVCARCAHPITHERHRMEAGGSHVHSRVNPLGVQFEFGCFADAPGCVVAGPPSQEASWFSGHDWQVAVCASCLIHLGWRFSGEGHFFGLILDRLRPGEGTDA